MRNRRISHKNNRVISLRNSGNCLMPKTVSVYFEDEKLHGDAMEKRVKPQYGGKFSPYVVDLVARDLAGTPPKLTGNASILVDLAKSYHPTLVPALERQLTLGASDAP